jgi:hypothetical protein
MRPFTTILAAATALAVASPRLAGAAELHPYSHVYSFTATLGGRTAVTSRWQDTLDEVTLAGTKALRRTQIILTEQRASAHVDLALQASYVGADRRYFHYLGW